MKQLIIILFSLISINATVPKNLDYDASIPVVIITDLIINIDTTVNNTWTIPATTILRFETGGHISGSGSINGGVIQASQYQNIFDTTLTVNASGLYNGYFSARWFGASPANGDNSGRLQKAITTCLSNWWLVIPKGSYSFSTMLNLSSIQGGTYVGTSIHISGDGINNFWRPELGTILNYTGAGVAIGIQLNKGTEINNLVLQGGWVSPGGTDTVYYNRTLANFTDQSGHGYTTNLRGISIDFNVNGNGSVSGSTATYLHDIIIKNFCYGLISSLNGTTLNNEINIYRNIQLGDMQLGIVSTQGQEKGNVIEHIQSWGNIYSIFSSGNFLNGQGGDYTIRYLNVAGKCIKPFNINQGGWGHISISDGFFEQVASIGTLGTSSSISINDCTFDFAYPSVIGSQTLATTNSYNTVFNTCTFRYFGSTTDTMHFVGNNTFNYCTWSGPYTNTVGSNIVNFPFNIPVRSNVKVSVQ